MKITHLFICLAGFLLVACETVEENDRFGNAEPAIVKKNVLVEEFTGQRCTNCPSAAQELADLQDIILRACGQQHVISVAIHGGDMAIDAPAGLATPLGHQYNNDWGIKSWPSAVIDREYGKKPSTDFYSWGDAICERLSEAAAVEINMQGNTYNAEDKALTINVETTALETVNGKLQVWLTESHINKYQVMPNGGHNMNYEHNHVFRDAVNGDKGENIKLIKGESISKTYSYTLPDDWKVENMAVVAFVYNESGVLQVVEAHVVNH